MNRIADGETVQITKFEQKKIVFLTGLHRSGTSVTHSIFKSHPQISGFSNTGVPKDEGQHLQSVYPTAEPYGGPGKFGFNPAAYLNENSSLITKLNQEKLIKEWLPYWDLSKNVLVEKSPPHLIRTLFLQTLFPDAFFCIILRHPLIVALATQKWSETSIENLIEHWLLCHEALWNDKKKLRNYIIFSYEDMLQNKKTVFSDIFTFIDLPIISVKGLTDNNAKYFRKWKFRYTPLFYGKLRQRLIDRFEIRINNFGYSLTDLNRYPNIKINR